MSDTLTPNYILTEPEVGASTDTWGAKLNTDLVIVDKALGSVLSTNVASGATLDATACQNRYHKFTGSLTGNVNVVVVDNPRIYWVSNLTTGAFTVTVKTAAGTGVTVLQGGSALLYSDGTNVVKWADGGGTGLTSFALGFLSSADAAAARTALSVPAAINSLTLEPNIADGDKVPFYDISAAGDRYCTKQVLMPTGAVQMYAGSSLPTGWLSCDGAAVSRSTYADLFAAVGTTYGIGNGTTTFNVPNFSGRMPVGTGQGLTAEGGGLGSTRARGDVGGAEAHTLTTAEMPLHGHPVRRANLTSSTASSQTTGGYLTNTGSNVNDGAYTGTPDATGGHQIGGTGGGGAHTIMSPFLGVSFIIKT